MDGIILIDKPENLSSYDVIKKVKKYFNTSRVGHCGTLDPFATGLLIIGVNNATKALHYVMDEYKEYIATIRFGKHYDTFDHTGNLIEEKSFVPFDNDKLKNTINSFKGEIEQMPPKYSAIKINGKPLYSYARENIDIDFNDKKRKVFIYDLIVLENHDDSLTIYVKCSKGTYIRSLGVDIASSLNNLGYLEKLRRISIGNINVNESNIIQDFDNEKIKLFSISEILNFKNIEVSKDLLKKVYNGQDLIFDCNEETIILSYDNQALAIYKKVDNIYRCARGLFDETTRYKEII